MSNTPIPDVEPIEHTLEGFAGRRALFDPKLLHGHARQFGNVIIVRLDCDHPYDEFWLQFNVVIDATPTNQGGRGEQ